MDNLFFARELFSQQFLPEAARDLGGIWLKLFLPRLNEDCGVRRLIGSVDFTQPEDLVGNGWPSNNTRNGSPKALRVLLNSMADEDDVV
jgi:hypothetical protein